MAIAFDASNTGTQGFGSTLSFTITPVGVPKAVVALINVNGTADQITSITYGGVALTRIHRVASGSAGTEIWLLGSGVPTGPQTLLASCSGLTDFRMHGSTWTASSDVVSAGVAGVANDAGGDLTLTLATDAAYSGVVVSIIRGTQTLGAGFTQITTVSGGTAEYAAKSGTNVTATWTIGFDFRYASAVALAESVAAQTKKTRVAGAFTAKALNVKTGGAMAVKPAKLKVGGVFV